MANELTATDRSLFQATTIVRWLAWAFAAIGLAVSDEHLVHPVVAYLLMVLALAVRKVCP